MISEKWLQIPVAPKYEINQRGDVRNIKTGRLLKWWTRKKCVGEKIFRLFVGKSRWARDFHQTALLWVTHGFIPKSNTHSRIVVPVIVSRGNRRHYFDSCRQAAQFLAARVHYVAGYIEHLLAKRREEIGGWRINYQR